MKYQSDQHRDRILVRRMRTLNNILLSIAVMVAFIVAGALILAAGA